jgi:quercetin dioxygenase-like cupin family protein
VRYEKRQSMKVEHSSNIAKNPVETEGAKDTEMRLLISRAEGAENFIMRMFELQPGGHTPLHTHAHEHEVFIVEGQGILVFESQQYEFGPEYVIFVPPNKEHRFKNTGNSILRMLCLIPTSGA